MLLTPREVEERFAWPVGRAERLAKRGKLPHVVLPDGSIRFRPEAVETFAVDVPASSRRAVATVGGTN